MIPGASPLVKAAAEHVFALFKERLPEGMFFHDFAHTLETTEIARSLAQALEVSEEQLELLTLAALFHDTGYTEVYEGHEDVSMAMARDWARLGRNIRSCVAR
jgi:putative nucleotidyltransferase with HDIG domain